MAGQLIPFSISAPGFFGINTEEPSVDLQLNFASDATNCIIDRFGRVGSRKGWVATHTTNSNLTTNKITCIGELIQTDGTSTILAAGGGFLFKLSGTTLTTLTYGGGGSAPTISANNWQFCFLNGVAMFWQRGYDPLIYDPAVSTTTFRRLSEKAGSSGTIYQCNAAISAYGRIWAADTSSDKSTIVWSDLITPHIWSGGTSGSIDLRNIWPDGGDEIVSMAAHNNFLYIFGKNQILIYSGADTPETMRLSDSVIGIGCVSRDTVNVVGEDIIFLSGLGLKSMKRVIQEKSAPISNINANVWTEIQQYVISSSDRSLFKSIYSPSNGFYILKLSDNVIYCFDMKYPLQTGTFRVTKWNQINSSCGIESNSGILYLGQAGYIGKYSGANDNGAKIRASYYSSWFDISPEMYRSAIKKIRLIEFGAINQQIVFKWAVDYIDDYQTISYSVPDYSVSEWGESEWGEDEWGGNSQYVREISIPASLSGKAIKIGIEFDTTNQGVSIQRLEVLTKQCRI